MACPCSGSRPPPVTRAQSELEYSGSSPVRLYSAYSRHTGSARDNELYAVTGDRNTTAWTRARDSVNNPSSFQGCSPGRAGSGRQPSVHLARQGGVMAGTVTVPARTQRSPRVWSCAGWVVQNRTRPVAATGVSLRAHCHTAAALKYMSTLHRVAAATGRTVRVARPGLERTGPLRRSHQVV